MSRLNLPSEPFEHTFPSILTIIHNLSYIDSVEVTFVDTTTGIFKTIYMDDEIYKFLIDNKACIDKEDDETTDDPDKISEINAIIIQKCGENLSSLPFLYMKKYGVFLNFVINFKDKFTNELSIDKDAAEARENVVRAVESVKWATDAVSRAQDWLNDAKGPSDQRRKQKDLESKVVEKKEADGAVELAKAAAAAAAAAVVEAEKSAANEGTDVQRHRQHSCCPLYKFYDSKLNSNTSLPLEPILGLISQLCYQLRKNQIYANYLDLEDILYTIDDNYHINFSIHPKVFIIKEYIDDFSFIYNVDIENPLHKTNIIMFDKKTTTKNIEDSIDIEGYINAFKKQFDALNIIPGYFLNTNYYLNIDSTNLVRLWESWFSINTRVENKDYIIDVTTMRSLFSFGITLLKLITKLKTKPTEVLEIILGLIIPVEYEGSIPINTFEMLLDKLKSKKLFGGNKKERFITKLISYVNRH